MTGERVRVLRVIARMNMGGPAYHVSLLSGKLDLPGLEKLREEIRENARAFAARNHIKLLWTD